MLVGIIQGSVADPVSVGSVELGSYFKSGSGSMKMEKKKKIMV
jgi:hypothetical protein